VCQLQRRRDPTPTQKLCSKSKKYSNSQLAIDEKDVVHPPGVEPGPIAWKAIILPLDQECSMMKCGIKSYITIQNNGGKRWRTNWRGNCDQIAG
jgi:hypothetical protein